MAAKKKAKKTRTKATVTAKKTTKKVTKKPAPKVSKKVSKKAAKKPTKKVVRKVSKKMAKKAPKKVTKKVAKKITKKATKKVTKKIAKKVSKKVAKKAAIKKSVAKAPVKKVVPIKKPARKTQKRAISKALNDNSIHGIKPYQHKASEVYMNPKQVAHFRKILLAWKANLIEEVSRTIHLMQDENINLPDPNDRASQETDMSLELRNRDRERKLLKKIASTVSRLDGDDYGWCERCGIEIGVRRLEARPTAELCVDCKTLNEIKERQMI